MRRLRRPVVSLSAYKGLGLALLLAGAGWSTQLMGGQAQAVEPHLTTPLLTPSLVEATQEGQVAPDPAAEATDTVSHNDGAAPSTPAADSPDDATAPEPLPEPDAALSSGDQPQIELTRKGDDGKQRVIRIVKTGSDEAGIAVTCTPQDDEPASAPTVVVYSDSSASGVQVTVDKNLIRAPLAVITKEGKSEGDTTEGGDGHIEMSAGTARFLDEVSEGKTDRLSRCAVEATPKTSPDTVFVTQGRTSLKGQSLVYDESDGVARIDGPITFERAPEAGKPDTERLTGNSERIEVNVDKETTTLVGKVTLKNGTRISQAEQVEYDDAANVAILRGSAEALAQSVNGSEVICAQVIRYNLDQNTVTAIGGIVGTLPDDDGGSGGSSGASSQYSPSSGAAGTQGCSR